MPTNEDAWEQYRKNEMSFQLNLLRGALLIGMLLIHTVTYIQDYLHAMGEVEMASTLEAFGKKGFMAGIGYAIYFFEQGIECSVRDKLGWRGAGGSNLRILLVLIGFNLLSVFESVADVNIRYLTVIQFNFTLSVCFLTLIALPIIKLPLKWHIGITIVLYGIAGILFWKFPALNFYVNQLFWRPLSFCFPSYETNESLRIFFHSHFGHGKQISFLFFILWTSILGRLYYKYLKKHTLSYRFSYLRYSDSGNKFTKGMLWLGKNSSKISLVRLVLYPVIFMLISLIMFGRLI